MVVQKNPDSPAAAPLILGIDPGLLRTGYAILADDGSRDGRLIEAGVIRLATQKPLAERLLELQDALEEIILRHSPSRLVCEDLYAHYKHPRTAILMAHARGVILVVAARGGLHIVGVSATQVKKTLTGSGRASKAQVQRAVAATLGLAEVPEPNDVADAIAIGICGLHLGAMNTARISTAGCES